MKKLFGNIIGLRKKIRDKKKKAKHEKSKTKYMSARAKQNTKKNTEKKDDEYIFVVLVKTYTGLGRILRIIQGCEYTHIAVCFPEDTGEFVSFSRKYRYNPFVAGVVHERTEHYAFGHHKSVKMKIFKVPVRDIALIKEYVDYVEHDEEFLFNHFSIATMPILHGVKIYKSHNCMSFVARILKMSGTVKLDKPFYKYNIKDIDGLLTDYLFKEDFFEKKNDTPDEYMRKFPKLTLFYEFIEMNYKLIRRKISG